MYFVDLYFWNLVSWMCMILGGVGQTWIISMSHERFDMMCHVLHGIIVRELGV